MPETATVSDAEIEIESETIYDAEDDAETIIEDLKANGVKPTHTFETWSESPHCKNYIYAWALTENNREVFEIGSNVESFFREDAIGAHADYSGIDIVDLFLEVEIFDGQRDDPRLVANILGIESIETAKPDDPGPMLLMSVTDFMEGGQLVSHVGRPDTPDDAHYGDYHSELFEFDSYEDADAEMDRINDPTYTTAHNEAGSYYLIIPSKWRFVWGESLFD